jgi:Fe-S cluster assembly scaffold protein SufB
MGQFERTLIIRRRGQLRACMQSCSAPMLERPLRSAMVEVKAMKGAGSLHSVKLVDVYNLVTKRAPPTRTP